VHCHHHQVLDRVADGLVVAARGTDGLIEAVELPGERFVLGVQWHPEQDDVDRRLFAELVRHSSSFRKNGRPAPGSPERRNVQEEVA
jgi:gamma-glutamyl-gamma-aminobutyrate hydrolase PuuD